MKTIYMRAVMREMILLLGVAGIESVFGERRAAEMPALRYDDFVLLRPQYSAVSWRVTASKLLKERLAVKTLREGKIALQLTRTGIETFLSFFLIGAPPESHQLWQLCFLKSVPGKRAPWVEARRLLRRKGFASIESQVFLRFQGSYDGQLAQDLRQMGFLVSFIAVKPDQAQPAGLQEFVEGAEDGFLALQRKLMEISKDITFLLNEVKEKKNVHTKDKKRIGSMIISGLALISELDPGWYLKKDRYDLAQKLASALCELALFIFPRL